MLIRKLLSSLVLAGVMAMPQAAFAKQHHGKNHKVKAKDTVQWRDRTERERYARDPNPYPWPRATKGHRPHDNNGDGVVTRNEWPGNDVSFRQLDRNGDGILSEADRQMKRRDKPIHH